VLPFPCSPRNIERRHPKAVEGEDGDDFGALIMGHVAVMISSALGRPRGMVWGGRREEGSGWGTHVYLWRIHFDIWQNQYNIVKFKNKIKLKKKKRFFYLIGRK